MEAETVTAHIGAPAVDRSGIVERSHRCLVYGIAGLIPFAGVGMAVDSARLFRRVLTESGDPFAWKRFSLIWIIWLVTSVVVALKTTFLSGLSVLAIIVPAEVCLIAWWMAKNPPAVWNPARRHLIAGALMGCLGISLSAWFVVTVIGIGIALANAARAGGS